MIQNDKTSADLSNLWLKHSPFSLYLGLCLFLFLNACAPKQRVTSSKSVSPLSLAQNDTQTLSDHAPQQTESKSETYTNEAPYQAPKTLPFPQYKVMAKYGEEQKLGVRYYTAQERDKLKLVVNNGLLYDYKGQKLDPELDNPKHSGRSGKAIFVISIDGQFWVTFDQRYGYIHHSSLLAGAPVLSAGELMIEEGQLLSISNASGHYKPAASSLDIALQLLKEQGVDLSECERFNITAAGIKAREQKAKGPSELLKSLKSKR